MCTVGSRKPQHRSLTQPIPYRLAGENSRGDLMADLDFALLRRVVGQAGGGDVVALLILENLVLFFHPRLPLLHFDL